MSEQLIKTLSEGYRDALLAYSLGQVCRKSSQPGLQRVATADDLYEYLLVDPLINVAAETTEVAQAISSLQQLTHAIYNGMEPGYPGAFSASELSQWNDIDSELAIWSANQLLMLYAENYIDPDLRLQRTTTFTDFINMLQQSRISDASIYKAVNSYMTRMEETCNISSFAGYMDSEDIKQAGFWFIGNNPLAPQKFFWRKAQNILQDADGKLTVNPAGWSEWLPVNTGTAQMLAARPLFYNNRFYIFYFSHQQDDVGSYTVNLEVVWLMLNDQWSTGVVVASHKAFVASDDQLNSLGIWLRPRNEGNEEVVDVIYGVVANVHRLTLNKQLMILRQEKLGDYDNDTSTFFWMSSPDRHLQIYNYSNTFRYTLTADPQDITDGSYRESIRLSNATLVKKNVLDENGRQVSVPFIAINDARFDDDMMQSVVTLWRFFAVTVQTPPEPEPEPEPEPGEPVDPVEPPEQDSWFDFYEVTFAHDPRVEDSYSIALRGRVITSLTRAVSLTLTITVNDISVTGEAFLFTSSELGSQWETVITDVSNLKKIWPLLNDLKESPEKVSLQLGYRTNVDSLGEFAARPYFMLGAEFSDVFQEVQTKFNFYPYEAVTPGDHSQPQSAERVAKFTAHNEQILPLILLPVRDNSGPLDAIADKNRVWHFESAVSPYRENGSDTSEAYKQAWNLAVSTEKSFSDLPEVIHMADGGEFLYLNTPSGSGLTHIRLNTLFASELSARANLSTAALLAWDTQITRESEPPEGAEGPAEILDFNGANGRYFWEIFFHMPHAIARRLQAGLNFRDAQNWYHFIFNPQEPLQQETGSVASYWCTRPLVEADNSAYSWEQQMGQIADPDAICYGAPNRYKKAIFMDYIRNILSQGDALYRQLTRDALTEARLHYARASSLLGPRPDMLVANYWHPTSLSGLASTADTILSPSAVAQLPPSLAQYSRVNHQHWQALNYPQQFRQPVNPDLVSLWDWLEQRLFTLRNNLTIDGKMMSLAMYEAAADPRELLRAQNQGALSRLSARLATAAPPYRFRAMLPRTRSAVELLSRFGEQLRMLHDQHDRAELEELQLSHADELGAFAIQLQQVALEQTRAQISVLEASQQAIAQRRDFYQTLWEENVSSGERKAMDLLIAAGSLYAATAASEIAGAVADLAPNIFGFAAGGMEWGAPLQAAADTLRDSATSVQLFGAQLNISETFRRRSEEWKQMSDQASAELEVNNQQLAHTRISQQMLEIQLAQARRAQAQTREQYQYLLTRNSSSAIYNWLITQMSAFYYQAYDAVKSLCLATEASWQFENGDHDTRFIQPAVWSDQYFGLGAGEALNLQLLQMENIHLRRHERRLEMTKSVSLKTLFAQSALPVSWESILAIIRTRGAIAFSLQARDFDDDYPGHYLRQIASVSVTLPGLLGPYQNVKARLTQTHSKLLLRPDSSALDYLYGSAVSPTSSLQLNARVSQAITVSQAYQDSGLFTFNFDDERYLPFEGTGAISDWELSFPRISEDGEQLAFINSLSDIIIQIRYLAREGNSGFTEAVTERLNQGRPG